MALLSCRLFDEIRELEAKCQSHEEQATEANQECSTLRKERDRIQAELNSLKEQDLKLEGIIRQSKEDCGR